MIPKGKLPSRQLQEFTEDLDSVLNQSSECQTYVIFDLYSHLHRAIELLMKIERDESTELQRARVIVHNETHPAIPYQDRKIIT